MRPSILDAAGHLDRAALGKLGVGNIDLVMGQLVSDPRIERRFLLVALRKCETLRHDRPRQHGRHRATIGHLMPPLDLRLLPIPCRDLRPGWANPQLMNETLRRTASDHIVYRLSISFS